MKLSAKHIPYILTLTFIFLLLISCVVAPDVTSGQTQTAQATQSVAAYKIGDTGPAGGLIFYDRGNFLGTWRYLEAASADTEVKRIWDQESNSIYSITKERALGTGKQNTRKIMEVFNNRGGGFNTATRECIEINLNGFNDWFLPSLDELSWMYGNLHRKGFGDFKNDHYWSSTQYNSSWIYTIDFTDGYIGTSMATHNSCYVRAIRQF